MRHAESKKKLRNVQSPHTHTEGGLMFPPRYHSCFKCGCYSAL